MSIFAACAVTGVPAVESTGTQASKPTVTAFGKLPDGRAVSLYTLSVPGGWQATITDYGATLTSFRVPARTPNEKPIDVVLGFDTLDGYVAENPYCGATCGRVSNRIAGGAFELNGKKYTLAKNNGDNHLHGGDSGFDKKLWKATPLLLDQGPALQLELVSPAGDEGYPGQLTATVTYTLTPAGELRLEMTATTDAPTIVNIVHHSYWNLAGHASGTIRDHELSVDADSYLPVDGSGIPTDKSAPVEKTPFDFRPERTPSALLGNAIDALPPSPDGKHAGGVDHNFLVRGWHPKADLQRVATLRHPPSGRTMEILSDQPGIQVYTGNYLDGTLHGKGGAVYRKQGAICLETQKYPDSIHHPKWPTTQLNPGEVYRHRMVHRFTK